jgi:hypothetical protein
MQDDSAMQLVSWDPVRDHLFRSWQGFASVLRTVFSTACAFSGCSKNVITHPL